MTDSPDLSPEAIDALNYAAELYGQYVELARLAEIPLSTAVPVAVPEYSWDALDLKILSSSSPR